MALGATVVAGDTVELLLGGSPLAHPVTHTVTAAEVTAGSVNLAVTVGDLGADGVKQISARLSDGLGNSSTTGALSVTLDSTAPAETLAITAIATDSGNSSSDFITSDTTLTVSGTNGALAAGEKIQVSSDGGTTWTDVIQNTSTSWSLADGISHPSSFTYQARIVDTAGNIGTAASHAVTIDTAAPVVAIGNPGGATNQPSLILTGTITGADAGTTIAIFDGATQVGVANISGGTWSANVTLNNGANLLTAQVVDAAGNTATSGAVTYTLNTTAPTGGTPDLVAGSDTGSSNSDNITSVTAPSFTVALGATVVAGDTVELLLGGSPLAHPVTHTVTAAEVTAGSVNLAVTVGDLGADGVKQVSARLSDGLGNSSTTGALSVTLDTTAPAETLAITAIASDSGNSSSDFTTNDTTLTVSGTNGALAAGEKIQVSSDGGTTWTDVIQNTSTSWSLADGISHPSSFTYQARIVDTAGNIGTAASQAVTIDTAAPVVAIGNPGGATNQPSLILTGTITGADAGTTIAIFDGVTQVGVANISGGTWSANVTLNNGANLLTAQVVDAAGNTATSGAVTYTLNTTAPTGGTPDLVAGSDTGSSNSDNITSVTAPSFTVALGATVVAGDTVELLLGGSPLAHPVTHTVTAAEVTAGSVNLAVTAGDLGADGVKQVSARLSDGLGNSSTTGALSVTLDTTAPAETLAITAIASDSRQFILRLHHQRHHADGLRHQRRAVGGREDPGQQRRRHDLDRCDPERNELEPGRCDRASIELYLSGADRRHRRQYRHCRQPGCHHRHHGTSRGLGDHRDCQ